MDTIKRLISDERGLETVEYAVTGSLIVVVAIVAITALGVWVKDTFVALKADLPVPG